MRLVGHVSSGLQAVVPVRVGGTPENAIEVAAVVDTGFTGFLSLRPHQILSLGLRYHGIRRVILAHGRIKPVRTYKALVWRGDEPLTAEVFELNHNPLLGMCFLLYGGHAAMDMTLNGSVSIYAE